MSYNSTYRDLIVWQRSMELVVSVYRLTDTFPKEEKYGLISQTRRCAVSIPSNIAEGKRRGTKPQFVQFLLIAFSSGSELETQIEIAKRLGFITAANARSVDALLDEVMRMLNKMLKNNIQAEVKAIA